MRRYWPAIVLPLLVILCALVAIRIVNSIDYRNNDFFTFWLAGHMVPLGQNPYAPVQWVAGHAEFGVTWIPNQAFVYPLPLSLLFIPLGWLDLKTAYIAWVTLSELMILGSLVLLVLARLVSRFWRLFVPLLAGLVFFRPAVLTLVNGQISGALLLVLAATVFLWEKGKWEWGSLPLSLLMLKPNLGAPLLALLGLWLLIKKQYKSLLVMAGGLVALLVIGFIQNPQWVQEYWAIGNLKVTQNTGGGFPTLWGLGSLVCQTRTPCSPIFGLGTSLLLVLGCSWMVWKRREALSPFSVVAVAAAVTLLVTPYTWTYDQVLLLLSLTAIVLELDHRGSPYILVATLFLGIDLLAVLFLVFDTLLQVEIFNVFIPLVILGLLAGLQASHKKKAAIPALQMK